jgi:hypothetical protein
MMNLELGMLDGSGTRGRWISKSLDQRGIVMANITRFDPFDHLARFEPVRRLEDSSVHRGGAVRERSRRSR